MKILISSYAPFTKSGYSTQIKKIVNCLHNYDNTIEFGFICWDVRHKIEGSPYSFDYIQHNILNNATSETTKNDIEIYKKSKFYFCDQRDNYWQKIHLFNNDFKCDKLLVYQDIWIFQKYDITKIDCKKYLYLPIHNDLLSHNLLSYKNNYNPEINTLFHLPFFDGISTFSEFGNQVLKQYGYKVNMIQHIIKEQKIEDKQSLRKRMNLTDEYFICLMVARNADYCDRKAFQKNFEAFSLFLKNLEEEKKEKCLLVLHESHTHSYKGNIDLLGFAKEFKIEDKIIFTGEDVHKDIHIAELYKFADLLLCSSKSEGFGLPMVECQFYNTPVITTNCTAMATNTFYGICTEPEKISKKIGGINSWSEPSPENVKNAIQTIYDIKFNGKENKFIEIDKSIYSEEKIKYQWVDFLDLYKKKNLNVLHSKLNINYGNLLEELNEQQLSIKYLTGKEKVLEIGGNIGRNSLIIGSIVDNNNFVTLESDPDIANKLKENRDINNLKFHIEPSALSLKKMIQKKTWKEEQNIIHQGWDTKHSENIEEGWKRINTITYKQLQIKYNIQFDTLILDCEGAFYHILKDMPEILININLIIMGNDYHTLSEYIYVKDNLEKNHFYCDYKEAGGWGPCSQNFYEVWKKKSIKQEIKEKKIEKKGKVMFDNHLKKITNILSKKKIRNIRESKKCKYNAVLIENREDIRIEPVLLNLLYFTNEEIGIQIFYNQENEDFIKNLINKYNFQNISLTKMNYAKFDREKYQDFIFSKEFYDNVHGEKILLFQTDSLLLKEFDMNYFNYDFIGAVWNEPTMQQKTLSKLFKDKKPIGNGGFNIRDIKKCKKIASEILNYQRPSIKINEDNVYSYLLQENLKLLNAKFPSIEEAKHFSVESVPHPDPMAIHAFYEYFIGEGGEKYVNNILQKHIKNLEKKIIDCFIFYNELDLLWYRLNILNNSVDYFIIVESTHTFMGKEKKLFFKENIERFKIFRNKIIHIIVEDFPYKYPNIVLNTNHNANYEDQPQWVNEIYQRNCISKGIEKLNKTNSINEKDLIIISDLDEIPDPNTLNNIKNDKIEFNSLDMDLYYYNLNSKVKLGWKEKTKIISFKKYNELNKNCNELRMLQSVPIIEKGGWHLSYFGNIEFIKNKITNFSHQEFNTNEIKNNVKKNIQDCKDLYGRNQIEHIPISQNNYLPPEYYKYLQNFYIDETMKIIYRISDSGYKKEKPYYINDKIRVLKNFLFVFKNYEVIIIADNVKEETFSQIKEIINEKNIIRTNLGNSNSFIYAVDYSIQNFNDNDIIYFVEDDYIHLEKSPKIIKEGLNIGDYSSVYDNPDKYIDHKKGGPNPFIYDGGEDTKVLKTENSHWKITNSCCMTFAVKIKTLKEDYSIIIKHCDPKRKNIGSVFGSSVPDDFSMFIELGKEKKRKIVSSIPSLSTHGETKYLAPFIDWEREFLKQEG